MNITISPDNIKKNNIYFHDRIKNTIINNGYFIRILYTDKYIISNGIQIKLPVNISKDEIEKLCNIEKTILNLYNNNIKHYLKFQENINYNLSKNNQLSNPYNYIILKISGIWENNSGIGITSKILYF